MNKLALAIILTLSACGDRGRETDFNNVALPATVDHGRDIVFNSLPPLTPAERAESDALRARVLERRNRGAREVNARLRERHRQASIACAANTLAPTLSTQCPPPDPVLVDEVRE